MNRPGRMSVAIISWITAWGRNDRCRKRPLFILEASVCLMDWLRLLDTRMICHLLCVSLWFCKHLTKQTEGLFHVEQCPKVPTKGTESVSLQGHL